MITSIQITYLVVFLFLATVTNSVAGFGFALVAASSLLEVFGLLVAVPLISATAIIAEVVMIYRYRDHLNLRKLSPIVIASLCAVPIGVLALDVLPDLFLRTLLGLVIVGYVLYKVIGYKIPELHSAAWAYFAGFLGGLLGGAYNTAGPPIVIYTDTQNWEPNMFRANMQTYLLFNNLLAVSLHYSRGNMTTEVWTLLLWAVPSLLAGLVVGDWVCRRVSPDNFRKIVLAVLFIVGVRLCLVYWT